MTETIPKKRKPPPAPKGNKYALGNNGGAPRTTSPEPETMVALGKEMIAWIEAHPDILHLSQWYTIEKMFTYNEWKVMKDKPEFHPYYEKALKMVGLKYLDRDSNVREGVSQRWQRVYFKDLREEEEETKDADTERKKKVAEVSTESLSKMLKCSADQIKQE
jgi:hypothetical protein